MVDWPILNFLVTRLRGKKGDNRIFVHTKQHQETYELLQILGEGFCTETSGPGGEIKVTWRFYSHASVFEINQAHLI